MARQHGIEPGHRVVVNQMRSGSRRRASAQYSAGNSFGFGEPVAQHERQDVFRG